MYILRRTFKKRTIKNYFLYMYLNKIAMLKDSTSLTLFVFLLLAHLTFLNNLEFFEIFKTIIYTTLQNFAGFL